MVRLNDAAVVHAIVEAHCELFARYGQGPGSESSTAGGITWYDSGVSHPIFNGAFLTDPKMGERNLGGVLARFRALGRPFVWWVLPSTPPSVPRVLQRHGLVAEPEDFGMALELRDLPPAPPTPAGFRVETVADPADLTEFTRTLNEADLHSPPSVVREVPRVLRAGPKEHGRTFLLGRLRGKAVATLIRVHLGRVVSLYAIATIPKARGRGIATALTWAGLQQAQQAGGELAVLAATSEGRPVYRRLGFREYCRIQAFVDPPKGVT